MNKVLMIGRIVRDPELNTTSSGINYVRFTVAINRDYNREQTDFIPIVAWRNEADFISKYAKKGFLISVEGAFTSSTYSDKNSQTVTKYEITAERVKILERKKEEGSETITKEVPGVGSINFESDNKKQKTKETIVDHKKEDVPWDIEF